MMERETLKASLRDLHERLQSGQAVDPELRALIQQVADDLDPLATPPDSDSSTTPSEEERDTLLDRLFSLGEEFEDSHPQLAEAIGNVASALSRIGI